MATQSITKLSKDSQAGIAEYANSCFEQFSSQWDYRAKFEAIDRTYAREMDYTTTGRNSKIQNAIGNSDALQNVTIPVVMPQVEAAVTYQVSVFLEESPLFGVLAPPENMDAALQLESILDEQSTKGSWVAEITKLFRDGFKYNLACAEVCWDRIKTPGVEVKTTGVAPKSTIWEGNIVKRRDLYNVFFDTRVAPCDIHTHGEFAGYIERISKVELKRYLSSLENTLPNHTDAFEAPARADYYTPRIVNNITEDTNYPSNTNWLKWAGLSGADVKIQYKDTYEKTTIYARILPSEFGIKVPAQNTPQIWKFVLVNNQVLVYAERQTNAHDMLPMLFIQPLDDGLAYQTKSLAQNVEPMQSASSTLMNSVLAARRRSIYDRTVYDPSRISSKDMNSPNPIANIPVRPAAYGQDLSGAFRQFPFNDNQSGLVLGEISTLSAMADTVTGQNKAQQGQFVKGNKTSPEFQNIMSNANSRSQIVSLMLESQFFTPLKQILKINILQYQGTTDIYNKNIKKTVRVNPTDLRKSVLEFKLTDGLLPTERLMNQSAFNVALQVIGSSPEVAQEYNLGALISYLFKSQGADVSQFEKPTEQLNYERAVQQWQQTAIEVSKSGSQFTAPMPKPEDFGWSGQTTEVNDGDEGEENKQTILERVMHEDGEDQTNTQEAVQ